MPRHRVDTISCEGDRVLWALSSSDANIPRASPDVGCMGKAGVTVILGQLKLKL